MQFSNQVRQRAVAAAAAIMEMASTGETIIIGVDGVVRKEDEQKDEKEEDSPKAHKTNKKAKQQPVQNTKANPDRRWSSAVW